MTKYKCPGCKANNEIRYGTAFVVSECPKCKMVVVIYEGRVLRWYKKEEES